MQNHDDALDVTQGVLVRQLRAGMAGADTQWGWLRRVTFNLCVDTMRKRRVIVEDAVLTTEDSPDRTLEADERRATLVTALDKLTDIQRHVLLAKVFDGQTFDRIASDAGLSPSSVKTHYVRALKKLRDVMGPDA